jgi:putative hemolysin
MFMEKAPVILLVGMFMFFAGCASVQEQPKACTKEYNPVCGVDNKTYGNPCFANLSGVAVASAGECPEDSVCLDVYNPVCGSDGKTYGNECYARLANASVAREGRCDEPAPCTTEYVPVCGKDGVTYGNMCAANRSGVVVDYEGKCYESNQSAAPNQTGIANPASVYCREHGGKLDIVTDADGNQKGFCTLPNSIKCEEWAYLRGECPKILISPEALAERPDAAKCWIVNEGKVYDITSYIASHTGDAQALMPYCGKTSGFELVESGLASQVMAAAELRGELEGG